MCRGDLWSPLPSRNKICSINSFLGAPAPRPRLNFVTQFIELPNYWGKGRRSNAAAALVRVFEVFSYRYEEEKFSLQLVLTIVLAETNSFHYTWLGANF